MVRLRSMARQVLWLAVDDEGTMVGLGSSSDTDAAMEALGVPERDWRAPSPEVEVDWDGLPAGTKKVLQAQVDAKRVLIERVAA